MKASLLITVVLCLSSCSPEARLGRLLKKHPELRQSDTIVLRDTMISPASEADTQLVWNLIHDTVRVEKDRLVLSLRKVHDTLYLRGKCKSDTVVIRRKIPVTRYVVSKTRKPWALWAAVGVLSAMVFLMIIRKT